MICPYCNSKAKWISNAFIYGVKKGTSHMIWICEKCDARVGCHNNTKEPLGTMANKELRLARMKVHAVIDIYWQNRIMSRQTMYQMLEDYYGKPVHIASADLELCNDIIKHADEILSNDNVINDI